MLDGLEYRQRSLTAKLIIGVDDHQCRPRAKTHAGAVTQCLQDIAVPLVKKPLPGLCHGVSQSAFGKRGQLATRYKGADAIAARDRKQQMRRIVGIVVHGNM